MPDGSKQEFFSGTRSGSTSTNYNDLINKPIFNATGRPVILNTLTTGVYKIDGSWVIMDGADEFDATAEEIFLIYNGTDGCRVTRLTSSSVFNIHSPLGGSVNDIIYDSAAMLNDILKFIMSSTQPTDQRENDIWLEILS